MTQFIADFSHYDGHIDVATALRIKADGIAAATHKLGEGTGGVDPEAASGLAALRDAGFQLIGAYGVPRTGDGAAEARSLIALADQVCPWWRSFPGWFWQTDLERWPYDSVSPTVGLAYARTLAATGKRVVLYASKGQYGDQLTGCGFPLWNANYPSSRQAPYRSLYPGDSGPGWVTYSGQVPAFWQYASSATIGGLTTCDISAYRGTYAQLVALLTGASSPTTGGLDMEQTDRLIADTGMAARTVGMTFGDLQNLRNWLVAPAGVKSAGAPGPDSVLGRLAAMAASPPSTGGLTDADRALIAANTAALNKLSGQLAAGGAALSGS